MVIVYIDHENNKTNNQLIVLFGRHVGSSYKLSFSYYGQ